MKRVLVVDDDAGTRDALALVLALEGYTVETAGSAAEAIASARSFRPDILLCDLGVGPDDGCDIARDVRDLPGLARIRLVALSGADSPLSRARVVASGFEAHLVKPVAPASLIDVLARPDGG